MIKKEIVCAEETIKEYLNYLKQNVDPREHMKDMKEA